MQKIFLILFLGLALTGCASVSPLLDSDAEVVIEYDNLPVYSQGQDRPSSYESYVSRCRGAMRTPAKNEKITLDMHLSDDCAEARLKTKAAMSDPTHAQTVAGKIEGERTEAIKGIGEQIGKGIVGAIKQGFAP